MRYPCYGGSPWCELWAPEAFGRCATCARPSVAAALATGPALDARIPVPERALPMMHWRRA